MVSQKLSFSWSLITVELLILLGLLEAFLQISQLVLLVGIVKLYSKRWPISVSLRNPTPSPNLTILCCLYSVHYGCWVGGQGNLCSKSITPHVCVDELCAYMRGLGGHIASLYSPETHTQSSYIRCVRICVLYIKWRYGLRTLNVTH